MHLNTYIKSLVIDGLHIYETDDKASDASYIKIMAEVDKMVVRDVEIVRSSEGDQKGCLIETYNTGKINTLFMNNILGSEIGVSLIYVENGNINRINAGDVYGATLLKLDNSGTVGKVNGESVL